MDKEKHIFKFKHNLLINEFDKVKESRSFILTSTNDSKTRNKKKVTFQNRSFNNFHKTEHKSPLCFLDFVNLKSQKKNNDNTINNNTEINASYFFNI
jgi:hypothetical protein